MDNSPGWRWDASQGAYLYWDGRRYTSKAREVDGIWDFEQLVYATGRSGADGATHEDGPSHVRRMIGLIVAQVVVLIWGGVVFGSAGGKPCPEPSPHGYVDPADLPWLHGWCLLLVVATVLVAVGARRVRADAVWMRVTAVVGLVVAVLTFPGVVHMTSFSFCGM